jgi:hypothetical protein
LNWYKQSSKKSKQASSYITVYIDKYFKLEATEAARLISFSFHDKIISNQFFSYLQKYYKDPKIIMYSPINLVLYFNQFLFCNSEIESKISNINFDDEANESDNDIPKH